MQNRVLGKGLDALIPKKNESAVFSGNRELVYLPLNQIKPGKYQPRQELKGKELDELTQSIKEKGIIQPILVRKIGDNQFEVVAGGRRFEAAKSLGHKELPAIIKSLDDKEALTYAIVENLQRKDLNPIEEAQALNRLMNEFKYSLDQVAHVVSKDKTTVSNTLRLLKLPDKIQDALKEGLISRSQGRTILAAENSAKQELLFAQILNGGLTVRELEIKVKKNSVKKSKTDDPHIYEIEEKLQKFFGTKIKILNKKNNKGKIVINYYSLDDFERILIRLKI